MLLDPRPGRAELGVGMGGAAASMGLPCMLFIASLRHPAPPMLEAPGAVFCGNKNGLDSPEKGSEDGDAADTRAMYVDAGRASILYFSKDVHII